MLLGKLRLQVLEFSLQSLQLLLNLVYTVLLCSVVLPLACQLLPQRLALFIGMVAERHRFTLYMDFFHMWQRIPTRGMNLDPFLHQLYAFVDLLRRWVLRRDEFKDLFRDTVLHELRPISPIVYVHCVTDELYQPRVGTLTDKTCHRTFTLCR